MQTFTSLTLQKDDISGSNFPPQPRKVQISNYPITDDNKIPFSLKKKEENMDRAFEHNFGPGGWNLTNLFSRVQFPQGGGGGGKFNFRIDKCISIKFVSASILAHSNSVSLPFFRLSPMKEALCLEYIVKGICLRSTAWYVRNYPQQTSRNCS